MAFNLAARNQPIKDTEISPNHYTVITAGNYKAHTAPFLVSSERNEWKKTWTDALYNVRYSSRIIGGSSMRSRTKRETLANTKDIPSPNAYNIAKFRSPSEPERNPRLLYVCRVPFSCKKKGPSIPSKKDINSYSIDKYFNLIKHPPKKHDTTIGPAYYQVQDYRCDSKIKYGGCRWSASKTARRTFQALNDNPGPGSYDVGKQRANPVQEFYEDCREMARASSFSPRYLEVLQKRAMYQDLPAPNEYNLQSPPKKIEIKNKRLIYNSSKRKQKEINRKPDKITSEPQFPTIVEQIGGAGEYDENTVVKMKSVRNGTLKFEKKYPVHRCRSNESPGPATYHVREHKYGHQFLKYKVAPFNTTSNRFICNQAGSSPGPAEYKFSKKSSCINQCLSSSFASRVPRDSLTGKNTFKCANVTMYNIRDAYNKLHQQQCHRVLRVGFVSKEPRNGAKFCLSPGPSDYLGHTAVPFRGCAFPQQLRFEQSIDHGFPGPETYSINQQYGSAMAKAFQTNNFRLKANVLKTSLRMPAKRTHDQRKLEMNRQQVSKDLDRVDEESTSSEESSN